MNTMCEVSLANHLRAVVSKFLINIIKFWKKLTISSNIIIIDFNMT